MIVFFVRIYRFSSKHLSSFSRREKIKQSLLNDSTNNSSTLSRKGRFTNGNKSKSGTLFACGKRSLSRSGKKGKNSKYQSKLFFSSSIFGKFLIFFCSKRFPCRSRRSLNLRRSLLLSSATKLQTSNRSYRTSKHW